MKLQLFLTTVAVFALGQAAGEASSLRAASDESRELTTGATAALADYIFFISDIRQNEDWCLTATEVHAHGNLGFNRCDTNGKPANQLWKLETNGLLRSGVQTSSGDPYCATIGYGHEIFDGVRLRLGPCDASSSYNKFSWNPTDNFLKTQNQGYCVTNRGPNPNNDDSILAYQQCLDRGDYKWNVGARIATPAPTPATVGCPATQQSGGQGFYEFNIEMNQSSGIVDVWYEMYDIEDSLVITYEGAVIYTTGGLVSGYNAFELTFGSPTSTSTIVTATLEAPDINTAWDIFIGCPKGRGDTPAPTPATVGCGATEESGGQGSYTFNIEMNQSSGAVDVSYEMFQNPDSLVISYEGTEIYSTGGLVSGSNTFEVTFGSATSTSTILTATVEAPNAGTQWRITIGCPK